MKPLPSEAILARLGRPLAAPGRSSLPCPCEGMALQMKQTMAWDGEK